MYSSAARVRADESGQDQEEQGPLDMSDSYRLNSPKPRCVVHIPKNRRESYIRFQGPVCAPEKGVVQSRLGDSENFRLDRQDREDLTTTEL